MKGRSYTQTAGDFYHGGAGEPLKKVSLEAFAVANYLQLCGHNNMLGLFYCPPSYIVADTPLQSDGMVVCGLEECESAGFLKHDESTSHVWIIEHTFNEVGTDMKPGDNRRKALQKQIQLYTRTTLMGDWLAKYAGIYAIDISEFSHRKPL